MLTHPSQRLTWARKSCDFFTFPGFMILSHSCKFLSVVFGSSEPIVEHCGLLHAAIHDVALRHLMLISASESPAISKAWKSPTSYSLIVIRNLSAHSAHAPSSTPNFPMSRKILPLGPNPPSPVVPPPPVLMFAAILDVRSSSILLRLASTAAVIVVVVFAIVACTMAAICSGVAMARSQCVSRRVFGRAPPPCKWRLRSFSLSQRSHVHDQKSCTRQSENNKECAGRCAL